MTNKSFMDKSGERADGNLPPGWTWERFKVVEAGNGEVGLWNPTHKRFIRMPTGEYLDKSGERADGTLEGAHWTWERFKVVDAGNGEVGLWNPTHKRFIRMPNGEYMEKSGERAHGTLPSNWAFERFKVVCVADC